MTNPRSVCCSLVALGLLASTARAEVFVDLGVQSSRVEADLADQSAVPEISDSGLHFGVGVRRSVGTRGDIGARLELDSIDSNLLLAVRALDYRNHRSDKLAFGAFLGAARLDLATPAYGYYLGGGVHLKELVRGWDLGIELRLGDKLARDSVLPTDPVPTAGQNDSFYDLRGLSVYLAHRF